MTKKEYNGWYNIETWQANLWYSEIFTELADQTYDQDPSVSLDDLKEVLAGMFENTIEEISGITELPNGFVKDVALSAWGEINWDSIADHYAGSIFELVER